MRPTAGILIVLSGMCFLAAHTYILVRENKTWSAARDFCRDNYVDLAAVHNQQDLAELSKVIGQESNVWIGLQPDPESWRWSLEDQDLYGDGEADFTKWKFNQPNGGVSHQRLCVVVHPSGEWEDNVCFLQLHFICYDRVTSSFIRVTQALTWDMARLYCRTHHTDLTSVRNQMENDEITSGVTEATWIGLYRDSWQWSDGSPVSITNWAAGAPNTVPTDPCGYVSSGKWVNTDCGNSFYFACSRAKVVVKKVVKLELKKFDASVDMEELQEGILAKLHERVKEVFGDGHVTIRWMKHPDGKIFHKKEEEDKQTSEMTPSVPCGDE